MPTEETRQLIHRSRRVADDADFLSLALASGDQARVDEAVDDLLASYDAYAGQAATASSRYAFDEVASLETAEERDQEATSALASALLDLEMAILLTQAAAAAGELDEEASADQVDESVEVLNETLRAVESAVEAEPGAGRFAFDEVVATDVEAAAAPDLPTAKAAYEKQMATVYQALFADTASLIGASFDQVSHLDGEQLGQAVQAVRSPLEEAGGGRIIPRILAAVQRALGTLRQLGGEGLLDSIEERVDKMLAQIREGEGATTPFLRYVYQDDEGQETIRQWLAESESDHQRIDHGRQELARLQQQITQNFAVSRRLVNSLRQLSGPIKWMLARLPGPGAIPLDLFLGGAYLLILDVALLRGMDYADTATLVKFVDGVKVISARTLAPVEVGR